jgi:aminomethyltransferase
MGRIEFRGKRAEAFLDYLFTRPITGMKLGVARYGHLCKEDGGILDDVIISRLEDHYLMVCNASNREKLLGWFQKQNRGFDVRFVDRTLETAMIAIQGREALETLGEILPIPLDDLKRYHTKVGTVMGSNYVVSRTGYTGEDGVEVTLPAGMAGMALDMLLSQSAAAGRPIKPAGLGARDTLRTEAGMPLYGHELSEDWDPISAGLDWVVDLDRDFIGKPAIQRVKDDGPKKALVGLEVDSKRTPRQGAPICTGGEQIGVITSGVSSPTLGKVVAMGFVPPRLTEPGTALEIDLRGTKLPAKVVPLPFYKRLPQT